MDSSFPLKATVIFKNIFEADFGPTIYDTVKGEVFMVEAYDIGDASQGQVFLRCITDPTIKIAQPIHVSYLKEA